jgi:phenylalanyl-tRNA synthetase beta chain
MHSESLAAAGHAADEAGLRVTVPPFRPDVTREADVIEEVARLWGYDRIPTPAHDRVPLRPVAEAPFDERAAAVARRLVGIGFREVYNNSLVSEEAAERFADAGITGYAIAPVRTLNPISREMSVLRPSLLHGLLQSASYNQARGAVDLRLFEIGHVYARGARVGPNEDVVDPIDGYHEHASLATLMTGAATGRGWDSTGRQADFFDLKGALLHAIGALELPDIEEIEAGADERGLLAERLIVECAGRRLGMIGRLSSELSARYDLRTDTFVAELDADLLAALDRADGPARYSAVSPFPAVERDLAIVVSEETPVGPLVGAIRDAGGSLVRQVRVFDLYRDERLGAGVKSVAFSLLMAADRTLTDEEVDARVRHIVDVLQRDHGARLRS